MGVRKPRLCAVKYSLDSLCTYLGDMTVMAPIQGLLSEDIHIHVTFCTGTYLQHIWTRQSDYPFACHKTWVSHPILSKAVYRAKNRIHIQYPNAKDRGKLIILSLLFQPDTTAEEFVKQSCKRGARNVYCIEDWNAIVSSTFTPTIAMEYRVGKLKFLLPYQNHYDYRTYLIVTSRHACTVSVQ